ncbi:hypothetical protein M758_11G032500 [Ceratodon purpureus]|nr:hypothetical protein M758_11G032500 [Ceratodon purpureus]
MQITSSPWSDDERALVAVHVGPPESGRRWILKIRCSLLLRWKHPLPERTVRETNRLNNITNLLYSGLERLKETSIKISGDSTSSWSEVCPRVVFAAFEVQRLG